MQIAKQFQIPLQRTYSTLVEEVQNWYCSVDYTSKTKPYLTKYFPHAEKDSEKKKIFLRKKKRKFWLTVQPISIFPKSSFP